MYTQVGKFNDKLLISCRTIHSAVHVTATRS